MNIIFIITVAAARVCVKLWSGQRRRDGHVRVSERGAKLHSSKVERQEEVALLVLSVGQVRGAREAIIKYNCNK